MSSAYVVENVDLTVAHERLPLVSTLANPVGSVRCVKLPSAAFIHFGQGGQPWPLEVLTYKPCPPERDGIFITNAPGGGTLVLGIGFDTGAG